MGTRIQNPVRRVLAAEWRDDPGGWLSFTITATGFLRGMVRSLVGTMAEVGQGKEPVGRESAAHPAFCIVTLEEI